MKAVSYSRYSSDNQREESIEAQLDIIQKYAKDKCYAIIKDYSDKALSGREAEKRASFLQMIEDAKKGTFQVVLIHKQNRFARNRGEAVYYKGKLQRHGVKVVAVAEDFGDGPVATLIESILEGFAEYQSQDLANEVMKGLMVNAKHCKHTGGAPLYGYRVSNLQYEIEEAEAEVVRFVFTKSAAGWSYAEIVRHLNDNGYRKRSGKKWSRNIIFYMLRNERYAGTYIFNQFKKKNQSGKRVSNLKKDEADIIRVPGGMPAIVTVELFNEVKSIMSGRQKGLARKSERYLLSGFIFCGLCGGAYTGQGKKIHNYAYYSCSRKKNVMDCDNVSVNKAQIEEQTISQVRELIESINAEEIASLANEYLQAKTTDAGRERDNIIAEITTLSKKIDNLLDIVEDGNLSVRGRLKEHSERKAQLESQLTVTPKEKRTTAQDVELKLKLLHPDGKDAQGLREIFTMLGLKIYIYPDKRTTVFGRESIPDNVQPVLPAPTLAEMLVKMLV